MFMFVLLLTFLVLSHIRIAGDALDWDFPRSSASTIITKNIQGYASYVEPIVYESFVLSPRRHLLEYPRWIKQAYRSNDYNVVRKRHQSRNKLDENRFYRSAVKDNEDDEDEEEEEEEEDEDEGDEEGKIDDENMNEEQDENEEEMVAAAVRSGSRNRMVRSGYVPFGGKVDERERQEVVRIRSATEECEDDLTESPQYYDYETEVINVAPQSGDQCRIVFLAKMLGASFLILLLT
ncbi:uncharacterized protein LOC126854608 [Cataglyphis hispanica]|uniref:uncharacterized protein LOC126854608 n=1 Tax=Cataglyphis hispanica TaxID=1086592 RepID=UPI0021800D2F|nr:uncharacterized protein LOC126854608 [Cataglyphis hispanica]